MDGAVEGMTYDYSFSIWIDEPRFQGLDVGLFCEVLRTGLTRCSFVWTEGEFNAHRDALDHQGFTMREIERREIGPVEVIL